MVAIACAAPIPVGAPFGRLVAADERINPDHIDRVEADGTALRVHLTSGRLLQGRELEGATLAIVLPGMPQQQQIRIESIVPDPNDPDGEILLYRIKVLDAENRR
jgi:hypothetical protein